MIRNATLKQKLYTLIKTDVYSEVYDKLEVIYIHIPKCAGTSISDALYGLDPWHYTAKELAFINKKKFNKYFKFATVRDPWDRIASTYMYAISQARENSATAISFIAKYESFEDFVLFGLNDTLVKKHYFFWKATDYLDKSVDKVIKFENLAAEWASLRSFLEISEPLEKKNKNVIQTDYKSLYSPKMIKTVGELYRSDILEFGYVF